MKQWEEFEMCPRVLEQMSSSAFQFYNSNTFI